MGVNEIVQLGFAVAVGGAVVRYLIVSARRQQQFLQRLVENHLAHNTKALDSLTTAITALNVYLRRNERPVGKGP